MIPKGWARKKRVAHNFSAAATGYDNHAQLQRSVADELLRQVSQPQSKVLDAGAGTGYALKSGWLGLDISQEMCRRHVDEMICGDMQQMPLKSACFDGVFSSLAMQWLDDPTLFLREAYRVTRLRGWLAAASFGTATLQELRQAFEAAGLHPPLLAFHQPDKLRLQLHRCGWNVEQMKCEIVTQQHADVKALLQQIKQIGARHKEKPAEGLRGKGWLESLENNYPKNADGTITSSWEVVRFLASK